MNMQRPLEGLLRPPIEWYTTVSSIVLAIMMVRYPKVFLLSSLGAAIFAGCFIGVGLYRFIQGYQVLKYQKNLKRLPLYQLKCNNLPIQHEKLFLGKGFQWTVKHTQRIRDLDLPYHLHYKQPARLRNWLKQKQFSWSNYPLLVWLIRWVNTNHRLNPFRPYPVLGGESCLHGIEEKERNIAIDLSERASHLLVLGLPGVGKTRFAELLISQDIHRGDVVIVIDPKGDADLLTRMCVEAKRADRENDLIIFHLGFPESSARYNPIGSFNKLTQVATRITNQLPASGDSAAFKEFSWKYINLVTRGLVALGVKPTYRLISFYITKMDELFYRYAEEFFTETDQEFEKNIEKLSKEHNPADYKNLNRHQALVIYAKKYIDHRGQGDLSNIANDLITDLLAAVKLDKTYYNKITASLGPLLDKLTTGSIDQILSPDYSDLDDERNMIDWMQVIRQKKIVYVGMDAMTDSVVASAVGNAMLSDLVSVAGHIYKYELGHGFEGLDTKENVPPRVCIHTDEFNEVIGDEYIPLLNKARGAGFNVTAYTQTSFDIEARLQSNAKAGQVLGNLGTVVIFRSKDEKTIYNFLSQLPSVPILRAVPLSVSQDNPFPMEGEHYQTSNQDHFGYVDKPLIEPNDILNLPKGHAFCLLEGGKLFKIRTPIIESNESEVPLKISHLLKKMQDRLTNIKEFP